jgi:hypothetical protein
MEENNLNEIYYETKPIEANHVSRARIKQFSLGMFYLIWLCEAQIALDKELPGDLDPITIIGEQFFDLLNAEVKQNTIQGLRNLADTLEYRDSN